MYFSGHFYITCNMWRSMNDYNYKVCSYNAWEEKMEKKPISTFNLENFSLGF